MNKIHLFIILGILILIIAIIFFYLSFFQKKKQLDKNISYERGYGYYSEEVSLGCKTTTCGELGTETFVQDCIVNKKSGKYCINKDGVYSSESVKRTQPCRIQCYGSQLGLHDGYEVENTKSIGLDNKITEYNTIKGLSRSIYIVDKNKGLDYTDYFVKGNGTGSDIKYSMKKNCIPDSFVGYQKNTIHCVSNGTNGTEECTLDCSNYNNKNTLRTTGNIFENYPEEDNINGTGKIKVCYDINNFNQLEILNSANEIPSTFIYPDVCYKHSVYKDSEIGLSLWPDSGAKNSFGITSDFTSKSKYFSFTGASITNFSNEVEKIINPTYNIQKDTNFYTKVMLNSEITLMDKVFSLGTCYLETTSLNDKYFYMKGSCLDTDQYISGIPGYLGSGLIGASLPIISAGTSFYYPFLRDDVNNLSPVHDKTVNDRKFYYFNTGVSEYIYFKKNEFLDKLINDDYPLYIDSEKFNGIGFTVNKNVVNIDDQFVQITRNDQGLSLPKSRDKNIFLEFKDFYHYTPVLSSYPAPQEILFTNNCFIKYGYGITGPSPQNLGSYKLQDNLFEIKKPPPISYGVSFYVYGTSIGGDIINPSYYYPLGICSGVIPEEGTSIKFMDYPGVSFYHEKNKLVIDKYTVDTVYKDFTEHIGFATTKVNFRTTTSKEIYPSNLEIISGGMSYGIGHHRLYNTLTKDNYSTTSYSTNIGVCVTSVSSNHIKNIKILRNNSIGVYQDIDSEDYKEKKLGQYYSMLRDQLSTGQNSINNSKIVILPQMSVSKACDFSIFKSPYTEEDGKKNYICFDKYNNKLNNKIFQVSNNKSNPYSKIINNATVLLEQSVSDYSGCCSNSVGVYSQEELVKPVQLRRSLGINLNTECTKSDLVQGGDYRTLGNFLEPCLQSRELQLFDQTKKDLPKFFTREVDNDKSYAKDEDLFTNYDEKDYYLNSSSGLKERVKFFQNSTNVYLNQLFTEVFDDSVKENGDFNSAPGICESIYNETCYSNNYSKQITYEVTKSGMLPMSPSDVALDSFSGHYLENFEATNSSSTIEKNYGNMLERSSNYLALDSDASSYGNWIKIKNSTLAGGNVFSPQKILFGLPIYSIGPPEVRSFKSRLYDNNINNNFNNIEIGDYISPDFTYFNKFFAPIFDSPGSSLQLIKDYIISVSHITPNSFYSSNSKSLKLDDYVLFVQEDLSNAFTEGMCYPTLEMGKVINITNNGTSIYLNRNVNNVNQSFLAFPPSSTGLSLFNLGNKNENIDNSIINNYYKISNIGISAGSDADNKRFVEFDFQIPSLTALQGSNVLIGPSIGFDNNLGKFIKTISQTEFDFQTSETDKYDRFTPALSCKFIKNKITFPSNNNSVVFSNYENPKLNTKLTSYLTSIKQKGDNYYINEFRENLNLLDKQEPLTFKEGDTINYYTNQPYAYVDGSDITTLRTSNPVYKNIATFGVDKVNYCMSAGVCSFEIYDYQCSLRRGTSIPINYYNSQLESLPSYEDYGNGQHSIPYNIYSGTGLSQLGGISSFYHNTGLSAVFEKTGVSFGIGSSIFMDYYKINDLPFNNFGYGTGATNFPHQSILLRGGRLDVLELKSTSLESENGGLINLDITSTIGKPYGNSFLLSTPTGPSSRVNFGAHGKINGFTINNNNNPLFQGLYTSKHGIQIRTMGENYELPELTFKSIENYKPITNSEDDSLESNNLKFTNLNTPQYFKNMGGTSEKFDEGVSLSKWEIFPETLYPSQNFITGKIGNVYYQGDEISHEDTVYKVVSKSLVLKENWWNGSGIELTNYGNTLVSSNDSFYTIENENGLSGFLKNQQNIQEASNLNNQNLPILIKNYTDELGDCPVDGTYVPLDYADSISGSFIQNTDLNQITKIFEDKFTIGNFGKNKILSLGFTPVGKDNADKNSINFLQDNFERNNNISQYIYSIDTSLGSSSYDKPFCTEESFNIGGLANNVSKFNFANSLLFNLLPNDLDSQDYIPYEGVSTFPGASIIQFQGDTFPVANNYFPGICAQPFQYPTLPLMVQGTGVCILNHKGISSPANFIANSIELNYYADSSNVKEGVTYGLQPKNYAVELSPGLTIEELGYNIFNKNCMIGLSVLEHSNNKFKYGDYWYIEDGNNNIPTFGYLAPDPGNCVSHNSFIQLKNLQNPLKQTDRIKIISDGGSVPNLDSFLNKDSEKLDIKKYSIIIGEDSEINILNDLCDCTLGEVNSIQPFSIYLNTYTNSLGTSSFLKYNEAIINGYTETINESDKLYLPITTDFYKYMKCKAVCLFGSNYFGKVKYSMDEEEKIMSMDGTSYNPLIFEPFEIDTFLNKNAKESIILTTGTCIKTVENTQDTFIISKESDDIQLRANPFTYSITNKYSNFVPNSLESNGVHKKLGIIDSQSTDVLITKGMTGVSFTQTGISAMNVAKFNEIYSPGTCVRGQTDLSLHFSEIRQNSKKYFQEKNNDCSMYFDKDLVEPTNVGGNLTFSYNKNAFKIDPISSNGICMTGTSLTIAKNLEYNIYSNGTKVVFSKDGTNISKKSEDFIQGTSSLQIDFYSDINFRSKIDYSDYLTSGDSGTIKLQFRENFGISTPYTIYYGLDSSDNFSKKGDIYTIKN